MLFNSYIFLFLFFPIVLCGYYGLNYIKQEKAALAFLCAMSFWFYGYSNLYYLALLIISILVNHCLTWGMEHKPDYKKLFLGFGVVLDLGNLFFFKYFNFFLDNFNAVFKTELSFFKLALPIGISFFTFQQLSYLIDYYRGESERYSLLEYACYVSFFPQLIAGPIVYHTELIPQFRDSSRKKFNVENFSRGMYAFACGLGKKVLIADIFSKVVNIGYSNVNRLNSISMLVVMLCYSVQIYFDFSGYSDMAYGLGYMCNMELPINFNSPFKADSIADLWNRWHITLYRFFVKYVYIPLGGSREGTFKTYRNILIVFLVSGFWHGANWTFICWGLINGIGVAINRVYKKGFDKIPYLIRRAISYFFFVFSFVFFRSDTVKQAINCFKRLFIGGPGIIDARFTTVFNDMIEMKALYRLGLGGIMESIPWLFLVLYLCIVLLGSFVLKNTQEKVAAMKFNAWESIVTVFVLVWSIMSLSEISEFLYYNF